MSEDGARHCCAFCGRTPEKVRRLIAGPNNIFICNICVDLCYNLLAEELDEGETQPEPVFHSDLDFELKLSPRQIAGRLDEYVIGAAGRKARTQRGGLQPL